MELLSEYHGFTICIKKETLIFNRKGENKTSRAYVNGALNAGCTYHFKLASLETKKYLPPNSTVKKWRYKKRWDRPTQILSGREEGLFSFNEYLDLIRSNAKGFTYKIAESPPIHLNRQWQKVTQSDLADSYDEKEF